MKRSIVILSLSSALLLGGCGHNNREYSFQSAGSDTVFEGKVKETKYYKNGVFKTDGHIYSLFHTEDWVFGISGNRMIESSDLVHWVRMGKSAFDKDDFRVEQTSGLDITPVGEKYLMAYVSSDEENGGICLAEASRIRGPYRGNKILLPHSGKERLGNPSFFTQEEERWLLWDTPQGIFIGRFEWNETSPSVSGQKLIGSKNFYAPRVVEKEGMYYLWATLRDNKGGLVVGRSENIEGPYITSDGIFMETGGDVTPTIIPNSEFSCISNGSAFITDSNNDNWILYHSRANHAGASQTVLMLDKIMWDNGWPVMGKRHASVASQRCPRF